MSAAAVRVECHENYTVISPQVSRNPVTYLNIKSNTMNIITFEIIYGIFKVYPHLEDTLVMNSLYSFEIGGIKIEVKSCLQQNHNQPLEDGTISVILYSEMCSKRINETIEIILDLLKE